MKWLKDRLREPSTTAGAAAIVAGLEQFAVTGNWLGALVAGLGAFAALTSERGNG